MKILLALPIIGLALGLVRGAVETVNSEVVVDSVERHIDLTSQLVKINAKIKLSNNGPGAIKSFHYAVDANAKEKLAFIGATVRFKFWHRQSFQQFWTLKVGSNDKTYLRVQEVQVRDAPTGTGFYRIELKKALSPGEATTVEVDVLLAKALEMYPKEIVQRERQLVLYSGNHYVLLPYKCKSQTTKITLPSATVESYSKLKPVSMTESTITYGPFANVEAYSSDDMTVHYENNNAFLVVSRLERVLEVSMWGNILVIVFQFSFNFSRQIEVYQNNVNKSDNFSREI